MCASLSGIAEAVKHRARIHVWCICACLSVVLESEAPLPTQPLADGVHILTLTLTLTLSLTRWDMFHAAHVHLLEAAAKLGDYLLVSRES